MVSLPDRSGKKKPAKKAESEVFTFSEQLKNIKKNLQAHNEKVGFHQASDMDIFYLRSCNIPDSIINFYQSAEPDDVVEINEARIWPISILKLENEKMEPGMTVFPLGYFVIGTTIFGDCYCLNLNTKNNDPPVVLVFQDRLGEYTSTENIISSIKKISSSFSEFLSLFSKGKLRVD